MKKEYIVHVYRLTGPIEKKFSTRQEAISYSYEQFQKPNVYKVKAFNPKGELKLILV